SPFRPRFKCRKQTHPRPRCISDLVLTTSHRTPLIAAAARSRAAAKAAIVGATSPPSMVNSAEPPPVAFPPDLTREGGVREAGGGAAKVDPTPSSAHRGRLMSLPSMLKPWGSQRRLRCVPVNRHGETIAPDTGSSSNQQYEVSERLQLGLGNVAEASGTGNPAVDKYPEVTEAVSPQPLKARRGRPRRLAMPSFAATTVASASPQAFERERRSVRTDALKRPRFSISLSKEEIEEDIYGLTGALPRSRPRGRPRKVQKQIDVSSRASSAPSLGTRF
uniref:Uncharacterized protein n=1 Tax=Aegilops tauschii subsp. strangulata TaxID=200361 RepID=A0A452XRJ9_AEGTS